MDARGAASRQGHDVFRVRRMEIPKRFGGARFHKLAVMAEDHVVLQLDGVAPGVFLFRGGLDFLSGEDDLPFEAGGVERLRFGGGILLHGLGGFEPGVQAEGGEGGFVGGRARFIDDVLGEFDIFELGLVKGRARLSRRGAASTWNFGKAALNSVSAALKRGG